MKRLDLYELKKSAEKWCDDAQEHEEVLAIVIIAMHADGTVVQSGAKSEAPQDICRALCSAAAGVFASGRVPMNEPVAFGVKDGKLVKIPREGGS